MLVISKIARYQLIAVVMTAIFLTACGSSINGVYTSKNGFAEKLDFKSSGKVEMTIFGMVKEGTYEIEGKKVKITGGGDTTIFAIDDKGCLDGGNLLGKYCKT